MKIIVIIVTILNILIAQSEINELSGFQTDTLYTDLQNSQIEWIGRKMTGEHSGTLGLKSGWVTMKRVLTDVSLFWAEITLTPPCCISAGNPCWPSGPPAPGLCYFNAICRLF